MESNYDRVCHQWQAKFLTWNHAQQMENLSFSTFDDQFVHLVYLTKAYAIDRKTGVITEENSPKNPVPFSVQMALYHIQYYAKPNPKTCGQWVPFRDVPRAGPFNDAFQKTIVAPCAQFFAGRPEFLRQTAQNLDFPLLDHGDVSFLVKLFPNLYLKFIFWDGDEEFPAQLNILFDKNIIDFTHEETVVMMAGDACDLLCGRLNPENYGNYEQK
ncbi:MAG: DUF3786 domain-containing protein [Eubacteriales bacterium]